MVEEMKENSQFAQKQLSNKEGFITYRFTSSSTRPINQEEAEALKLKRNSVVAFIHKHTEKQANSEEKKA